MQATTKRWLKIDAVNRAWRTTLQGILAVVVLPALVAAVEVVQRAVVDASGGRALDWTDIRTTALHAAGTAALMAFFAYLHRAKLDPSAIPSAQPPTPPATPPQMAPATRGPLEP